jgi:hypothetical protein
MEGLFERHYCRIIYEHCCLINIPTEVSEDLLHVLEVREEA